MSVEEIREAIANLSQEERRDLVKSLTPKTGKLTPELLGKIRKDSKAALARDTWVSWEDLKAEP